MKASNSAPTALRRSTVSSLIPPLGALILILLILEIGTRLDLINAALIPPPSAVFETLIEWRADYIQALIETATASLLGLLGSVILGVSLAVALSLWPLAKKAVLPFAIFFQTVPIIAIAPLLVIYFGFGLGTVFASSLIVSVFPVLANTLLGLESVDPGELELFRLYGARGRDVLFRLRLPRAYPSIYAGLKVAIGLSVIGAVAGEFVAGGGLGALIDSARTQQRIDVVFGALLILSALGLAMIGALRLIHRLINLRRPYGLHLQD